MLFSIGGADSTTITDDTITVGYVQCSTLHITVGYV